MSRDCGRLQRQLKDFDTTQGETIKLKLFQLLWSFLDYSLNQNTPQVVSACGVLLLHEQQNLK